jgi:hypothetical protein
MSGSRINLEKKDFHKLEMLNQDKCFQMNIIDDFNNQSKSYLFTKEQIFLLSPSVYQFIIAKNQPFNISYSKEFIQEEDKDESISKETNFYDYDAFIKAFNDICSLFSSNESIQINEENQIHFISIAKQLQNETLLQACESLGEFFFTTNNIKSEENYLEKDMTIKLKDCEIQTNYIFSSLISHKIRNLFQENQSHYLDFSDFIFPHILTNVLRIYVGILFIIGEYDLEEVITSMVYLQIDFCKYENLIRTKEQFQRIITYPNFYIQKRRSIISSNFRGN